MALKKTKCGVIWLLGLAILAVQLPAAPVSRDSLLQALNNTPAGSEQRAHILQQLSKAYCEDIPDEAIFYGEELIGIAEKQNLPALLWQGHMSTGIAYAVKGDSPETALQHFIDALNIAKGREGKEWELRQVKSRINISGVHWQRENLATALDYAYQNVWQLERMEEPVILADAYRTVALLHRSVGNYDSTFIYLNKALEIYGEKKELHREAFTLTTLGGAYLDVNLFEQAQQILYQAQRHALLHNDSTLLRDTYAGLSRAHLKLHHIDSAQYYARALLATARPKGLIPEMVTSYQLLSDIFFSSGLADSAFFYYRQYSELREKLIGEEKTSAIQEIDARYRSQEKAKENRLLREQNELVNSRNTLLMASSVFSLFLIILIGLFYYRLRRRKAELEKLNMEVSSINARLLALMNQKKYMVSLIAHDIRNPLSLIQLNAHAMAHSGAFSDEEKNQIIAEIEEATQKIDRASLKIMDIENKADTAINIQQEPFDLLAILKEEIREFAPVARSKSIGLLFQAEQPHGLLVGDPFLIRHIVANLLSNAIKYSPPHKRISLRFYGNYERLFFEVKDEGPGLSEEEQEELFQRGKTFHSGLVGEGYSRGEGLYLSRRYVEAMGGAISVESRPGQGACFTVSFPASPGLKAEK